MSLLKRRKREKELIKKYDENKELYSKFITELIKNNDTSLDYIVISAKEFWNLNMIYKDYALYSQIIGKLPRFNINLISEGSTLGDTNIKIYIEDSKLSKALKKEEELKPLKSFISSRIKIKETKNN